MYKDKEKQREAVRKAVAKKRKGITKGITQKENVIPDNPKCNTQNVIPEEMEYCPLMTHLVDPIKRRKLQAIVDAFDGSSCGKKVTFGYYGANLDEVSQMLDLTASLKI